jgi:uncharacterized protein YndB with AHSA1/START domain
MTTIDIEQHVPAKPADVWSAWTTPEGLAAWWWPQRPDTTYDVDVRPGESYRIVSQQGAIGVHGTFVTVDEPHLLELTWIWIDEDGDQPEDRVRVTFAAVDDGQTLVTVSHLISAGDDGVENYRIGWVDVLERLNAVMRDRDLVTEAASHTSS